MSSHISDFIPSSDIIEKYAQVLVNFALNSGAGVKAGEVVQCVVPDVAKPLALALQNTILRAGAHPMIRVLPTGFDRDFYSLANEDQLSFFPKRYLQERVKVMDHQIGVIADVDPEELQGVDPQKIIRARDAKKKYRDWIFEKETQGFFTWTLALWGVPAKAAEVGLSLEEYWQQIIKACFLDASDPIAKWRSIFELQQKTLAALNQMEIEYVTIKGKDIDLKVTLGANRVWVGGSGRNIPSFELFTSPDWRGVEGWVRFNQPLYRYGNIIRDIYLELRKGIVVKASAKQGEVLLQQMLKSPNAKKIGEFSLTDKRTSRISHVMAETLYDENIGGPFGNTHLAIGLAYKEAFRGDRTKVSKKEWRAMGFNDSPEHTDMISTTDRTVVAYLTNGTARTIYKNGIFVV